MPLAILSGADACACARCLQAEHCPDPDELKACILQVRLTAFYGRYDGLLVMAEGRVVRFQVRGWLRKQNPALGGRPN